jgi:probable F420-dependent oxidoreductase
LKFGIALPRTHAKEPADTTLLPRFLSRAESLPAYQSIWVSERILGPIGMLEPVTLLSYAAGLTRRLRLGTAILVVPLRNPVQLAKSLASLDQLSGGRLDIGVGLGPTSPDHSPAAFGIADGHRGVRFTEAVTLMKQLWMEPRVTFHGQFWKLNERMMEPKPVQQPHPPLWFGAHSEAAIERAVALGNGWIGAGGASRESFLECMGKVRRTLDRAGRDPSTFGIAKRVYIALDEDRARIQKRVMEWFRTSYGSADLATKAAIFGGRAECVDRLAELGHAGAESLILEPVFDELEHLERLAQDVIPALEQLGSIHPMRSQP